MSKLSTFKKYFVAVSLTFLFCITGIVLIVTFLTNNYLSKEKFDSLSVSCETMSSFVETDYKNPYYSTTVLRMTQVMSRVSDNMIFVTDNDGTVIACSCSDFATDMVCEHSIVNISDKILNKVAVSDFEEIGRFSYMFSEPYYIKGEKIVDQYGKQLGYVFATAPASTLTSFYKDLFGIYALAATIPIIILFVILYFITYKWSKPLKLMSEASKAMANGDFSKRIPVMSNDEIGQLSSSFNQMTNSLVELEKMRRDFIANVSHELRTPMTTIGGFIDGIIDGTIEKEKTEHYLQTVSNEVKRMTRLVEGMLNLSKLEAGEIKIRPSEFDFKQLVIDVVLSQEQRIENKKIEIVGLDSFEKCIVRADKDLLHQVVYNLCDNAIKFTDDFGTIEFDLSADSTHFEFKIKNTGIGIPKEDLPHIFDRFYKGDKARSTNKDSTGLGLYLVKTIVRIHGGTAFVKSSENEFTQFGIRLAINS